MESSTQADTKYFYDDSEHEGSQETQVFDEEEIKTPEDKNETDGKSKKKLRLVDDEAVEA